MYSISAQFLQAAKFRKGLKTSLSLSLSLSLFFFFQGEFDDSFKLEVGERSSFSWKKEKHNNQLYQCFFLCF